MLSNDATRIPLGAPGYELQQQERRIAAAVTHLIAVEREILSGLEARAASLQTRDVLAHWRAALDSLESVLALEMANVRPTIGQLEQRSS